MPHLYLTLNVCARLAACVAFTLLVGGCATSWPYSDAVQSANKQEIFRVLRAEGNKQKDKDSLFEQCIYWSLKASPEKAAVYLETARDLARDGANMYAHIDAIIGYAHDYPKLIGQLRNIGFDLNARNSSGTSIAFYTAIHGNPEVIRVLAQNGANLDIQNNNKVTPLGQAVFLWATGGRTSGPDRTAAMRQGEAIAKALLSAGAKINTRYWEDNRTVLHRAAEAQREDIIKYLISVGGDPSIRNRSGDTVASTLQRAREARKQEYETALAERQQAAEREQSRREADAWLRGEIASLPNRMNEQMARVDAASRGTSVEEEREKARIAAEFSERIAQRQPTRGSSTDETRRQSSTATNGARENGGGTEPVKKQRRKFVQEGFNDGGVMAASSILAIERDTAQVKKVAEKWVSERMNGSVSANAVITEFRVRECTAMGGNPLFRRCLIDITYEADDPN